MKNNIIAIIPTGWGLNEVVKRYEAKRSSE